ncbi:hypothetical protein BpHYR1_003204, partial [Brachionus plicatilis]
MIKLVKFFLVCFLIENSYQLNFDANFCFKSDQKEEKSLNGHKIIEQSFFSLELSSFEYDLNTDKALTLQPKTLHNELSIKKVLIQAFSNENDQALGTWEFPLDSNFQLFDCEKEKDTIINNNYNDEMIYWRLNPKEIRPDSTLFFSYNAATMKGYYHNLTKIYENQRKLLSYSCAPKRKEIITKLNGTLSSTFGHYYKKYPSEILEIR